MANKFFIRNFIKNGFVTVNNLKVTYLNYVTKLNDIISFEQKKHTLVFTMLKGAVRLKRFFAQPPFYLEINYRTLCLTLIPSLIDPQYIAYPFRPEDNHLFMVYTQYYGGGDFKIYLMTHLKVKLRIVGSKYYKFKQY